MPERGSGGYDPTAAGRAYRSVRRDDRRLKPDSGGGRVTASPDPVPRAGRRHQSRRYQSCRRLLSVGTACPGGPIGSSGCAPFLEPGRWSLTAPRPSFRWRLQVSVANVKFTGNPAASRESKPDSPEATVQDWSRLLEVSEFLSDPGRTKAARGRAGRCRGKTIISKDIHPAGKAFGRRFPAEGRRAKWPVVNG